MATEAAGAHKAKTHTVATKAVVTGIGIGKGMDYEETHSWKGVPDEFVSLLESKLEAFDNFLAAEAKKPKRDNDRIKAVFTLTVDGKTETKTHKDLSYHVWDAGLREFARLYSEVVEFGAPLKGEKAATFAASGGKAE